MKKKSNILLIAMIATLLIAISIESFANRKQIIENLIRTEKELHPQQSPAEQP